MKKLVLAFIFLFAGWQLYQSANQVSLGPGIKALSAPKQQKLEPKSHINIGDYKITQVASFEITAKVLGKKNYRYGEESKISPIDLALGWGSMSDEQVLEEFKISQSGRFFHWRSRTMPISKREVITSSANMHMIPADDSVQKAINQARTGDIIELKGTLVNVSSEDGWRWKSSLTRKDTGAGACEIIYVKSFEIITDRFNTEETDKNH